MNRENIEVLDAAYMYRDMGLSVIPVVGKQPAIKWRDFQSRRPHTGEIMSWFGVLNETRRNIGIVTGKISGVVAIDIDSKETAKWWFSQDFPYSSMMTKTSEGRGHIYFQIPKNAPEIRNKVKVLGRELDIRGEGGYCVAAPSIHPETGKKYERIGAWNLINVPEFPSEWLQEPVHISEPVRQITNGFRNVRSYIRKIVAVSGQGGHNATYRVACKLRDAGLSESEALAEIIEWNQTNAEPPWPPQELLHKVTDAFRSVKQGEVN